MDGCDLADRLRTPGLTVAFAGKSKTIHPFTKEDTREAREAVLQAYILPLHQILDPGSTVCQNTDVLGRPVHANKHAPYGIGDD